MANIKFTNFARSQVATGINSSATTLAITGGTGALFPALTGAEYFYLTLENSSLVREIVKVTARTADTLTIVRAQDGTTALSWVAGDTVSLRFNAAAIAAAVTGTLLAANNLSDVANAATARANLGALAAGDNIGSSTATTQTAGDNSTKVATTAYVATAISGFGGSVVPLAVQTFTSSGTFTPNAATKYVILEGMGAGGNGGAGAAITVDTPIGGGGGGGGSAAPVTFGRVAVTAAQTVTIGATGGASTTFGALFTAVGGNNGTAAVANTSGGGSAGTQVGTIRGFDLAWAGGAGGAGSTSGGNGGAGGGTGAGAGGIGWSGLLGPGAAGGNGVTRGAAGGGGGGARAAAATPYSGGAGGTGAAGYLIVYEFG